MKPLNQVAAWGMMAPAAGNPDRGEMVGSSGIELRQQTAQCVHECCEVGLSGCGADSWQPLITVSPAWIGMAACCIMLQPIMAADAKACSGRASIIAISRRWLNRVRTQPV